MSTLHLDSGNYKVVATSINTGCISDTAMVRIDFNITDPVFEVKATSSICLRTLNGEKNQFTGTGEVVFLEPNRVTSVTWTHLADGDRVIGETKLIDAKPGLWNVVFTALNGCEYEAEFEIKTAIKVYNVITENNDGKNDFFLIDCLYLFPDNNVKIYNRDGTRVYEIDRYDNDLNKFEGVSNVGSRERRLPTGTYFYIIDKGDGTEPIQGYLELVR